MPANLPAGFSLDPLPSGFVLDDGSQAPGSSQALPAGMFANPMQTSTAGAFGRGMERSALPTAAGVAGFGPGAAAGAWAISPIAALSGPFAPVVEGGGALLGGLAGSGLGGWAANKAQNYALDQMPSLKSALGLDDATTAADQSQHPYASFAGDIAPQALFLRPGWAGTAPALIGGAIGGGMEASRELSDGKGFDPLKLGMATGAGALLQRPTALGRGLGVPADLAGHGGVADPTSPPDGFVADKPTVPVVGGMVTDPISGRTAPAVDPQTGAAFFQWGEDSTGARYPDYGLPDPSKATPGATSAVTPPSSRLVVDIDGGAPAPSGGSTVIDGPALKAASSNAAGEVSMAAAGQHLRSVADQALSNGAAVTLHVDGKAVPITGPGLTDAQGQSWGAMPILTSEAGRNNRLEVTYPDNAAPPTPSASGPSSLSASADPPPGFVPDPVPSASDTLPSGYEINPPDALPSRSFSAHDVVESNFSRPTDVGPFGPIHTGLAGEYRAALHRLSTDQTGEVPGAINHPTLGPIDLVWGEAGARASDGYGLAKIVAHHPEVVEHLPDIVASMDVKQATPNRVQLESADHKAAVRLDYDGQRKNWLLTAFKKDGDAPASTEDRRAETDGQPSAGLGAGADIRATGASSNPPPGFVVDEPAGFPGGRPLPRHTPQDFAAAIAKVGPQDILPRPANTIDSLDEAMRANPGSVRDMQAPDERDALTPYTLNGRTRRNPIDLVGWLRTQGGLRETGGELVHMGITNKTRPIDFARDEGFLGKLIDNDKGMSFDDAAHSAWEAGFFPDHAERPSINEFLDAVHATHNGGSGRVFHPDDWGAVDSYQGAQRQRYAVEAAKQAGAPLAESVGDPVSLSDLNANQPPATTYDDLARAGGKVGNIRVDGLNSTRDIQQALQTVSDHTDGFSDARRGRMAQAETEALASELNMTAADLLKRRKGQALNAEQALAARQLLARSGDELVRLAGKAKGGSDADVAAFRAALTRHTAIQEQVSGMTAEAGRLLAQFKMTADANAVHPSMLKTIIESAGGRAKLEDIADKIVDLEKNPTGLNSFVGKALKPGWIDKLTELYINSLLSGPRTHATNIGGNLLTMLWTLSEHAVTAGIGAVTRSSDRMTIGDVGARAMGMIHGARDGLRLAARSFRTESPIDGESKVEAEQYHAISGLKGKLIRIPTRALTAEDEFFKAVAYRGELNALAAREAGKSGGTRAERANLFANLRDNPSEAMVEQAKEHARYITFQAPLKSAVGQGALMISRNPVARIIVPFVRTPTNILKFAVERSPFAPALGEFRDAIRAGGMQRDQALSRVTMGSGLAAMAVLLAKSGMLTGGGPTDRREVSALRDTGWQPYSMKVGDSYYSYQRVDPFARVLSTAADFTEFERYMTPDERQQFALKLGIAVARNLSTMPLLDPASSFFNALSDPDRFLSRYVDNLAASAVVPQAVAQFNSTQDPDLRDAQTLLDTVKSRVPGLSETLPARMNVWGYPIRRGGALGPDILSPIFTSKLTGDPVANEVARLNLGVSPPQRKFGAAQMTPDVYAGFTRAAGQPAKKAIGAAIASPAWDSAPDGIKRIIMRDLISKTRDVAKMQTLAAHPDLLRAYAMGQVNRKLGNPQ